MTAREIWKRSGEEARRGVRAVAGREWAVRAAQCLIRLLLGAVLAGGELFGRCAPFGLALVGCSGGGPEGFCAVLGAGLGYLSFREFTSALRYTAAAILIYASSFALSGLPLCRGAWFLPTVTAVMDAVTGFAALPGSGLTGQEILYFATEVLLSGSCTVYFGAAFSAWDHREGPLTPRQLIGSGVLIAAALLPLARLALPGGITVGQIGVVLLGCAAAFWFLLPRSLPLPRRRTAEADAESEKHLRTSISRRLAETAASFRSLQICVERAFPSHRPNDADHARIFDRAAERVCRRCSQCSRCWQKEYVTTYNALNDALPAMLERGRGAPDDFPSAFRARCTHFPEFLAAADRELTALLCRQEYQSRLRESRSAVGRQYGELADVLSFAAAEFGEELSIDPAREERLRRHLAGVGKGDSAVVFSTRSGHLRAEVAGASLSDLGGEDELSRVLGVRVRAREDGGTLLLQEAEPLTALAGAAARSRTGETVSGDTGIWFKREDGHLFLLLCDGMGSGCAAGEESTLAARLLEQFLHSGVSALTALRTISSALALRGEETGAFTTVDLLEVDLFTGEAALYKYGAAPTYLCHGGQVRRLSGSSLPAGAALDAVGDPDVLRFSMEPGDCAVLISDGVSDPGEDAWLRQALACREDKSPRALARALLDESGTGAADDKTILCLRIERRRDL